jgi:hypothetical protein
MSGTANPARAALVAAIRALEGGAEQSADKVDRLAVMIELACAIAGAADLPRAKETTEERGRAELSELADDALRLWTKLSSMHRNALAGLEARIGLEWLATMEKVAFLAAAAKAAADGPLSGATTAKGRPTKQQATDLARICAQVYRIVTGETATVATLNNRASGPFLAFVTTVFLALGIKASPELHARRACEKQKSPETSH